MNKKNVLYNFKGNSVDHNGEINCEFFCKFSHICSHLYDEDNNVFLKWANNKYDNTDTNVLDYIFNQLYPTSYDIVIDVPEGKCGHKYEHKIPHFFTPNSSKNYQMVNDFNYRFWNSFKVSDEVINKINPILKQLEDKNTLAVHIRRSGVFKVDYFKPYIQHDPNDLSWYYNKIMKMHEVGNYDKIFVCTEDLGVLEYLKERIPSELLVYNDVYRTFNAKIDKFSDTESKFKVNRENNGKLLLIELISDIIVASKCTDFMGSSFSGVSIYIELLNNCKFRNISYINFKD